MAERKLIGKTILWVGFALEVLLSIITFITLYSIAGDNNQATGAVNLILVFTIVVLAVILFFMIVGFKNKIGFIVNIVITSLFSLVALSSGKLPIGTLLILAGCIVLLYDNGNVNKLN